MANSDSEDEDTLLSVLHAHGQAFLQSFGPLSSSSSAGKKRKRAERSVSSQSHHDDDDEWHGIDASDDDDSTASASDSHGASTSTSGPRVVVFGQPTASTSSISMAEKKAFMSSKVSKMRSDASTSHSAKDKEDAEEEKSNARNDIVLHDLIQTSLLSGSLADPGSSKSSSQKRKALEGRAMELAGIAKRGRGERTLKHAERGKAVKRVRVGMEAKEAEVNAKRLEEAKNVGNYHPTIKKLFGEDGAAPQRKRERGLGMGIGKFVGGTLKLTARDLASVRGGRGAGGRGAGGGRGRGRGRGKR